MGCDKRLAIDDFGHNAARAIIVNRPWAAMLDGKGDDGYTMKPIPKLIHPGNFMTDLQIDIVSDVV